MDFRLRLGRRVFAPSAALTALMFLLAAAFIALGRWQWRLGDAREVGFQRFQRGADHVVALAWVPLTQVPLYQRVMLTGSYDGAHQFLLDNSIHDGRDGYQVLTPLRRPHGDTVLIDRGWVPFTGNRARLPAVSLGSTGPVSVTGRVGRLPTPGLSFGRAPPPRGNQWPKVTSFPTVAELSAALGRPVDPRILLLDPAQPNGYERDWRLAGMPALENWGYAIQWWVFAAAALVIWGVLSLKRAPS
jgi:surfeit locus 1 family protein